MGQSRRLLPTECLTTDRPKRLLHNRILWNQTRLFTKPHLLRHKLNRPRLSQCTENPCRHMEEGFMLSTSPRLPPKVQMAAGRHCEERSPSRSRLPQRDGRLPRSRTRIGGAGLCDGLVRTSRTAKLEQASMKMSDCCRVLTRGQNNNDSWMDVWP